MTIPHPLPESGFSVALRASFLVFKMFPIFGVAANNAAPRLVLFDDRIEFRVSAAQTRRYEELEYVHALQTFGTQNLILCWRRRFFAFSANVGDAARLSELLRYFELRGIALTARARSIVAKNPDVSRR